MLRLLMYTVSSMTVQIITPIVFCVFDLKCPSEGVKTASLALPLLLWHLVFEFEVWMVTNSVTEVR